jgi:hypothetical protein
MGPLGPFIHKPVEARCASAPLGVESMLFSFVSELKQNLKTFNKGSLGSRIDEERSKARNVM